jgi:RNA polymerase sigma-70 factor, ECF subfamily
LNGCDTDEDLLRRIARNEPAAVRAMVVRKLPKLLALASRLLGDRPEAEDVAQETFLRIWRQAPHWQFGQARFDTWLHRVALNLCYDRLRKRRETAMATPPDQVDPGPAPDHALDQRTEQLQIAEALAALPERQRAAIVLQYYQELSNIEAADVMGISVEALESLLARARRNLRAFLDPRAPRQEQIR